MSNGATAVSVVPVTTPPPFQQDLVLVYRPVFPTCPATPVIAPPPGGPGPSPGGPSYSVQLFKSTTDISFGTGFPLEPLYIPRVTELLNGSGVPDTYFTFQIAYNGAYLACKTVEFLNAMGQVVERARHRQLNFTCARAFLGPPQLTLNAHVHELDVSFPGGGAAVRYKWFKVTDNLNPGVTPNLFVPGP